MDKQKKLVWIWNWKEKETDMHRNNNNDDNKNRNMVYNNNDSVRIGRQARSKGGRSWRSATKDQHLQDEKAQNCGEDAKVLGGGGGWRAFPRCSWDDWHFSWHKSNRKHYIKKNQTPTCIFTHPQNKCGI